VLLTVTSRFTVFIPVGTLVLLISECLLIRYFTPVGRIIRKPRLDELPQLFNGLKGAVSMVGLRPERPEFVQTLVEQIP
jgi:hypothetical protein